MKATEYQIDVTMMARVADLEKDITETRAAAGADRERIGTEQVEVYGDLAASIWDIKLTKGNLPQTARMELMRGLVEIAGVRSKAKAKRYLENTVGLSRERRALGLEDKPSQAGGAWISARLIEREITSESKISRALAGDGDRDEIDDMISKLVGSWSYRKTDDGKVPGIWKPGKFVDQYDEFLGRLSEAKRVHDAATKAAESAEEERATYEQVQAVLTAVLFDE